MQYFKTKIKRTNDFLALIQILVKQYEKNLFTNDAISHQRDVAGLTSYFPIQNRENMSWRISSGQVSPVISPR